MINSVFLLALPSPLSPFSADDCVWQVGVAYTCVSFGSVALEPLGGSLTAGGRKSVKLVWYTSVGHCLLTAVFFLGYLLFRLLHALDSSPSIASCSVAPRQVYLPFLQGSSSKDPFVLLRTPPVLPWFLQLSMNHCSHHPSGLDPTPFHQPSLGASYWVHLSASLPPARFPCLAVKQDSVTRPPSAFFLCGESLKHLLSVYLINALNFLCLPSVICMWVN